MWAHYLIQTPAAPEWPVDSETGQELPPPNWVETSTPLVYLFAEILQYDGETPLPPTIPDLPELAGSTLIGGWDQNGDSLGLDLGAYKTIRPLGNNPPAPVYDETGSITGQTRGGDATGPLLYAYVAGMPVRKLGPSGELYPPGEDPFAIEVRHKLFTGNDNAAWDGWGWRAEIVGDSGSRDPSARAIGIYNDAECTSYWYTTGAFSEQASEWQTDEQGDLLTVWATEYNPAFLTNVGQAEKGTVHHAVLLGSAQEGYATLSPEEDGEVHLFWEKTQGQGGGGTDWIDTGVTVTSYVGAGTYDTSDASIFSAGELLRIGGAETEFVRVHSADIIVVDPDVGNQTGESIFRWE